MGNPRKDLPQDIRSEITELVSRGKKIDAIKRYREATGCDLKTGKEAIESFFDELKYATPPSLPAYSNSDSNPFDKNIPGGKHRTDGPLNDIPQHIRHEITGLLYSGNKIAAIKRYRETASCSLKTAKAAIESFAMEIKATNPGRIPGYQDSGDSLLGSHWKFFVLLFIILIAIKFTPRDIWNEWPAKLDAVMQAFINEVATTSTGTQASKPQVAKRVPAVQPSVIRPPVEPEVQQPERIIPYEPVPPGDPDTDLTTLYRRKLANQDYVTWKNQPGLPKGYQDFTEEHHIKYKRAAIARHLILPTDKTAFGIPLLPDAAIALDGVIRPQEWARSTQIRLDPPSTGSTLYLQANEDWLYLAADVPGDTTPGGYDQFRFYIHVDIDPAIRNERIHVGRSKSETLGGIRQTRIEWQGSPPANDDERWKKYPISDWRIYRLAKGASTVAPHRQFEAKLNLKESGLAIGSPFPVFVEIETDPVKEGKSRKRMYLGGLGRQDDPAWMIMRQSK